MHVEINDALTLLMWAQNNPDGCVRYTYGPRTAPTKYLEHPMCAYDSVLAESAVNTPMPVCRCYPDAGHANEDGMRVDLQCTECWKPLYP